MTTKRGYGYNRANLNFKCGYFYEQPTHSTTKTA